MLRGLIPRNVQVNTLKRLVTIRVYAACVPGPSDNGRRAHSQSLIPKRINSVSDPSQAPHSMEAGGHLRVHMYSSVGVHC